MSVRHAACALTVALAALAVGAGSASAATDHVVITGGAVIPTGATAGDVIVVDGPVTIAGHATGDVVAISGPVRVRGRVDGDEPLAPVRETLSIAVDCVDLDDPRVRAELLALGLRARSHRRALRARVP